MSGFKETLKKTIICVGAVLIYLCNQAGYAATGVISPGRIDMQTTQQVKTLQKKPDKLELKNKISESKLPATATKSEKKLLVKSISLVGFPKAVPESVSEQVKRLVNKNYTLSNLKALALHLQRAFRTAGYILVRVILPPQRVRKGKLTFKVIPGYISHIEIRGNTESAKAQLNRYLRPIEADKPLQLNVLEHYLLLANRIPGLQVKTVLTPDRKVQGGATLVVNVEGERFSGFANFTNRMSRFFGYGQGLVGVTINRLFGADALSFSASLGFPDTSRLIYRAATYNIQLGSWGTDFQVQATDTRTKPGGSLENFNIRGESEYRSISITQPVIVSRQDNLSFSSVLYHLTSSNEFADVNIESFDDKITAATLGGNFNFYGWHSYNDVNLTLTRGLPWDGDSINPSRVNAKAIFTKLNGNVVRTQFLSPHWNIQVSGTFQYTNEPLMSSEQFGVGGSVYGLAYDYSEITGDSGIAGQIKLNYTLSNPLRYFDMVQPFLYYDIGKIYNSSSSAAQHSQSAASAGGGINLVIAKHIQGSFVVAKPLTFTPGIPGNRHVRYFFNITALF